MKIAVYTAITDRRYWLRMPLVKDDNVDYIAFIYPEFLKRYKAADIMKNYWDIRDLEEPELSYLNKSGKRYLRIIYKRYKILAHKFLSDYDYSIWVDSTYMPMAKPTDLIKNLLSEHDMALFAHPSEKCIYDEAKSCMESGLGNRTIVQKQIDLYKSEGYPENNGLVGSGVILRRHTDKIAKFNELWMQQVLDFSIRDQISFNYATFKCEIDYKVIPGDYYRGGTKHNILFYKNPNRSLYRKIFGKDWFERAVNGENLW